MTDAKTFTKSFSNQIDNVISCWGNAGGGQKSPPFSFIFEYIIEPSCLILEFTLHSYSISSVSEFYCSTVLVFCNINYCELLKQIILLLLIKLLLVPLIYSSSGLSFVHLIDNSIVWSLQYIKDIWENSFKSQFHWMLECVSNFFRFGNFLRHWFKTLLIFDTINRNLFPETGNTDDVINVSHRQSLLIILLKPSIGANANTLI